MFKENLYAKLFCQMSLQSKFSLADKVAREVKPPKTTSLEAELCQMGLNVYVSLIILN
jgi:hypothetical protein